MYIQVGDSPVAPEVTAFAACMEAKLRMEGGQLPDLPTDLLLRHMEAKIKSLRQNPGNPKEAFSKAVALGLFAMLIAENFSQEQEAGTMANLLKDPSPQPPALM